MNGTEKLILLTLFVCFTLMVVSAEWTFQCPSTCSCKWTSGKKAAECRNRNLRDVPEGLSGEIQIIDLSGNNIDHLRNHSFAIVNLASLSKIHLQESQIKILDVGAFGKLGNLVELDLSENHIQTIHPGTFNDNKNLRILILSKNPIRRIEANVFNLNQLGKLHLDDCLISEIHDDAFINAKKLTELKIEKNGLVSLKLKPFIELTKLISFYFYSNPWNCDCNLRDLRNWVIERNLLTEPTECSTPKQLERRLWRDIEPDEFACPPQILWPPIGKIIFPENQLIEIGCKVTGNPMPQVHWFHNSRSISDDSTVKYNANRYTVKPEVIDYDDPEPSKWVNLTVGDLTFQDKGQFRCVAESPGGTDIRNVTLLFDGDGGGYVEVAGISINSWPLIIGLATGLIAFLLVACLLVFCFCCQKKSKSSKSSITNSDKQDESLLAVNPIQKPPRSYDTQISPDEGVELSELNTKLLDENSLHGTVCTSEGNQSAECLESIPEDRHDAYPPDLLSFPSRRYNTSPAGGSITRTFDPLRTPLSPGVHSLPPHRYNFGTLPYSRSHSPLAAGGPVVLPRQGYVTIPRRPRVPSWSSAPTPSLLDDPLAPLGAEPIYDNLGPRTTADGSSVLSLNKSIPENPRKKKTPHMPYYFHFESPCPSPLAAAENVPRKEEFRTPPLAKSPLPEGEVTPVKKIAPKPPPKPKKGGPLFEDEGEDGTEV